MRSTIALGVALVACSPAPDAAPTLDPAAYTLVDLTHPFNAQTIYWPTSTRTFEHPQQAGLCGACMADPPAFARARTVMRYDEASKTLILRFKNADRVHAAPALARWMARAGGDVLAMADLIVPIPLHWRRLLRRRYNQSALLARALARHSTLAWCPDALRRTRPTPTQGGLSVRERRLNVRGAFAVPDARRRLIEGKRVLLVDDVLTTGATLDAAAKALRRAGAESVDAVAVDRVLRAE